MTSKAHVEDFGQALVELSIFFAVMCVFVFGIIDFGRAIYGKQVIENLAGEGSSLASRGTDPDEAAQTVTDFSGSAIDLAHKGCVIITVVTNQSGTLTITDQGTVCAITAASRIGCLQGVNGCHSSSPNLPTAASTALRSEASGSSMYVTEVFYTFSAITPEARFLNGHGLPSQLYSVAYF